MGFALFKLSLALAIDSRSGGFFPSFVLARVSRDELKSIVEGFEPRLVIDKFDWWDLWVVVVGGGGDGELASALFKSKLFASVDSAVFGLLSISEPFKPFKPFMVV